MARSSERTEQYAQKVIDSADIVREAIFRQLTKGPVPCGQSTPKSFSQNTKRSGYNFAHR
jgi:hypothetical protein